MKIIFDYNRTLFDPETNNLYPHVFDLLKKLSAKHDLLLVSRNVPSRKLRFEELHMRQYFQEVFFVDRKSKELFRKISGASKEVFVVGDSIGDEIAIGNQLGLITIRVKKGLFATSMPQKKDAVATYDIEEITDVEKIIENYEK